MRGSVLLLSAVASLLCAIPALATTHLVENSKNSGSGSLRDAIAQANADASATPADPDTIRLTQAVLTDISPSAALPDLAGSITLIGPDSLTVQIKGAKTFRAFTIDAGATVRMVNLRVTSGTTADVGAGILNAGDLTMINCNLRNHTTGSLGGAVQNTGRLTLIRCWLDKNKVKSGSGLATGGGAINNDEPGVVVATNCTFSNNACPKGGYGGTIRSASSGGVWLDHCTIAFGDSREPTPGGGGIATVGAGVTHVDNSIIVGSVTGGDLFGPLVSDRGHNVFGSTDGGVVTGSTDGDIVGVDAASVIEPTLEHSGVLGRTHALIPGSPALDAAVMDPARDPATDGRDMPRGVNGASDIGAFEEQQPLGTNLVANGSFEGSLSGWSPADGDARITLVAGGMAGASAVHVAQEKAKHEAFGLEAKHPLLRSTTAGERYRFSAFVRSNASLGNAWLQLREVHGEHHTQSVSSPAVALTPAWQLVTAELTSLRSGSRVEMEVLDTPGLPAEDFDVDLVSMRPVLGPDTPPRVLAPPAADAFVGLPITIGVNAFDADGDTLALIAADASALASPSTFTFGPDNRTGQFLWTPLAADTTDSPYAVVFSAENARTGHVVTTIRVLPAPPNLAANPDFELGTTGWGPFAGGALSQSADAHSGTSALLVTGSSRSSATFGATDVPDPVAQVAGAGSRYRFLAWVKAGSRGSGTAKLRVREFLGERQVAPSCYSLEVPLAASWQLLSVDYVASRAGSSLDLRVTEAPAAPGASFLVDDVTIIAVGNVLEAPALMAADDGAGDAPAASDEPALRIVPTTAVDEVPGFRTVAVEGIDRELEAGLPAAVLHVGTQQVLAAPDRTRAGLDLDGNGIEEVVFAFPDQALATGSGAEIEIAPGTSHAIRLPLDSVVSTAVTAFRAWLPLDPILSQGTLVFTTTRPEPVRVQLFDTSGRRVQTLEDEANADAGRHTLAIGGRDAALRSGVYFYRIATGEGVLDGHFALIR